MRRIGTLLAGVALGAVLLAGGQALADIPDNGGTKLYFCVAPALTPYHNWQVLDKDQGNGQCAAGWTEHAITVVPDP